MAAPTGAVEGCGVVHKGPVLLDSGNAPAEAFPQEALADLATDILRHRAAEALQYGELAGYLPLRRLVAEWLAADGVDATPEEIMIVTGAKQALDICARAFCSSGGAILLPEPTYMSGLKVFRMARASLMPVPEDEDGMDVDAVERLLDEADRAGGARPKLIYNIPDFNNPSGTVMTEDRREKLVDLALRHEIPILEDAPYRWIRLEGQPLLPPLKRFDRSGLVISTGTLSKILAPGLRLGWVHASREVLRKISAFKADGGSSPLAQMLAYEYAREPGSLARHLAAANGIVRARRDAMLESLASSLGTRAFWTKPGGGYYVWVSLRGSIDTDALLPEAAAAGVTYCPGSAFFARDDPPRKHLRLSFSFETEERIRAGIGVLADVISRAWP